MSHSTVLVIGEDYETLLAPYDEEIQVDPYWTVEAESPNAFWVVEQWIKEGELPDDRPITWEDVLAKLEEKGWSEDTTFAVIDGKLQRQSTYNPLSRWDWYAVGGRWRGSLRLKDPQAEAVRVEPGFMETINGADPEVLDPRQVDRAQKKDLDIEGMRTDAVVEAIRRWDQYTEILLEHGHFVPFETIWDKHVGAATRPFSEEDEKAAQAAREEYRTQPAVVALKEAHLVSAWSNAEDVFGGHTRESYLRQAWGRAIAGYATLTKDGWLERGRMGWFGVDHTEPGQEEKYLEAANAAIDAADDDEWFTIVDVHI